MKKLFSISIFWFFFLTISVISYAQEYRVGEGDILRVTVYGHNDLTTVERIGGDGDISFPLIGSVKVTGLTVSEVSKKIERRLEDGYIIEPQVTVFIEEFRSQKVVIMGELKKPGLYELKGYTTFLELLSLAGGLTDNSSDTAVIKRKQNGSEVERHIIIDLKRLIEEGDTSLDVPIMDGDSVYISKTGVFYVTGEVKKPDAYRFADGTTVIQAITMAGGFTEKASATRIKIIRNVNGAERVLKKVKMDVTVLPDDVIVVPESFF